MRKVWFPQSRLTLSHWLYLFALAALLTALAVPYVNDALMHSHREHARAALTETAQWMESSATQEGRYPVQNTIPLKVLSVEGDRYVITAHSQNGLEYTLTAMPIAAQSQDACGAYRINQAGTRLQLATSEVSHPKGPLECWQR